MLDGMPGTIVSFAIFYKLMYDRLLNPQNNVINRISWDRLFFLGCQNDRQMKVIC